MVAYNYLPQGIVGAQRPARFARYLPELGFRVSVITGAEQDAASPPADVHYVADQRRRWAIAIRKFLLDGEEALPWIAPAIREAERVLARERITAVYSTSPPPAAHAVAYWLKKRHGIRWVADFRDPIAGNPIRQVLAAPWIDGALEPLLFRAADAVIANTDAVARMWRQRHPRHAGKVSVIWNGFDPCDELRPAPRPPRSYRLLTHIGSIYEGRYPAPLMAAVDRLARAGELDAGRLRIRLIGMFAPAAVTAAERAMLEDLQARGLVELVPPVAPAEARRALAEADANLLADMLGAGPGLQLASKIFDYLRIGRPVLAVTTRGSPADWVLERAGVPYVCLYAGDPPEQAERALRAFLELPGEAVEPNAWFRSTFDGRAQTAALAALLGAR